MIVMRQLAILRAPIGSGFCQAHHPPFASAATLGQWLAALLPQHHGIS